MDGLSIITGGKIAGDIVYVEKEPIILYGRLQTVVIKHYIGEVGKTIIINCGEDISGATTAKIMVKKPDGSTSEWVATVYAMGGRCNYIKYVTIGEDIVDENADGSIDDVCILSRVPIEADKTTVKIYDGRTLIDTLTKTSGTDGVEVLTGTTGITATITLRTGSLHVDSSEISIDSVLVDYSSSPDFNVSGKYELQAYIEKGGFRGYGTTDYIVVSELFD